MTPFSVSMLTRSPRLPESSSFITIKTALSRWRSLWIKIRSQIPTAEWETLGFIKNSYHFWLVAQLLVSKKKSVDVIMGMKVNCDDKLEQLKVLLQDDAE
jgi:hypothetical protein